MSLKIGQVNLIATEGGAAFNIMYKMDDAFRASPAANYGVAVYAGKKLLAACRNKRDDALASQYTGDDSSPQGYTNAKGIKDWQDPVRFTGMEESRFAVNMYYASSAGSRENQLVGGANSGGVHTIITYADGKILDAKVVKVQKASELWNTTKKINLEMKIGALLQIEYPEIDHLKIKLILYVILMNR